jgi:Fe-coproporphyrin III synthase
MTEAMGSSCGILAPIFQIHPTRRCNLRCLHCYSASSPEARDDLTADEIADALTDSRAHGYLTASFSGGEPVLFSGLGKLLKHAKSLGMRTTVTSNGMLLNAARLNEFTSYTDVLAISLDGVPVSHDRMRNCAGAFDRMEENLAAVRASGVDFGFIFTLTQHNVDEAEWAAAYAVKQGAKLFQIHPLEEVGRAADTLTGASPDPVESAFAFLEAERIRKTWGNKLFVQLDVFHRELVAKYPERFYADERLARWPATLSSCITPLVLEADGTVVPMGYGFSRDYALGNIRDARLSELAPKWMAFVYPRFRDLCRRVYAQACAPSELPFLNWYELLQARAAQPERITEPMTEVMAIR